jgi:hypothetical protein
MHETTGQETYTGITELNMELNSAALTLKESPQTSSIRITWRYYCHIEELEKGCSPNDRKLIITNNEGSLFISEQPESPRPPPHLELVIEIPCEMPINSTLNSGALIATGERKSDTLLEIQTGSANINWKITGGDHRLSIGTGTAILGIDPYSQVAYSAYCRLGQVTVISSNGTEPDSGTVGNPSSTFQVEAGVGAVTLHIP